MKLIPRRLHRATPGPAIRSWGASLSRVITLVITMALVLPAAWAAEPADAAPSPPEHSCPPVAQPLTPEQVHAGMRNARDRGFLWRISKAGRSSYLFGTIHVAKVDWMFPGPTVFRALNASDTLALEMDMLDPDVQQRLARQMTAEPNPSVPGPLKERLQRQVAAACLPATALDAMSPEMQITTLNVLVARHDGLDPQYGIDVFLAGFGRGARKAVVSLETPELQMQALRTPDPAEALEVLALGLADLEADRVRPMLNRIAQVWAGADLGELQRYEAWCDCGKTEADRQAMKRLLDDRNPALADKIAALHDGGRAVFAAVGSLHMIGPLGLPELMAQRGFSVDAVAFQAGAAPPK